MGGAAVLLDVAEYESLVEQVELLRDGCPKEILRPRSLA
jgi:PHD/YefM family antitoxin component YafN of YafNO toxin-antitoxin module